MDAAMNHRRTMSTGISFLRRRHEIVAKLQAIRAEERAQERASEVVDALLTERFASGNFLQHEPQNRARRVQRRWSYAPRDVLDRHVIKAVSDECAHETLDLPKFGKNET